MIFEANELAKIEQAIVNKDEKFFYARLDKSKRRPKKRRIHSALMVSAHRARHLNKLDELPVDAAILNLEDGVAPPMKRIALLALCYFLQNLPQEVPLLVVRINSLQEGGAEEIALLNRFVPDAIRVPKVRSTVDVQKACELIDPAIAVHASCETKDALGNIASLIHAGAEVLYLGILDLLADLSLPQSMLTLNNPTIDYILAKFLIDVRSAGAEAVSFVYQNYKDVDGFIKWCEHEKAMGYEAKACISPDQARIVNRIFKQFDFEKARYIKKRFEEMAAKGMTGFRDEKYGFIDEPIYKDALHILQRFNR